MNAKILTSPTEIAAEGERIYNEKYKAEFEKTNMGQFVAIDVLSGKAFVAEFSDQVLEIARKAEPLGVFHLIKIGFAGAFRVSSVAKTNARSQWVF